MRKYNELFEELKREGSVVVSKSGKWTIGLEVWDNGSCHVFVSDDCICANGIMYDEEGTVMWDWMPFSDSAKAKANSRTVKKLYWDYKRYKGVA